MQPIIMTPDDNLNGIQHVPKICVDYLSHEWTQEDDIWASWKAMSKHKKDISNGLRLENASWRTWAKQKYNLKTVNPNKLNWLKDSDVTWLYGPLHRAWSNLEASPKQKTEDNLNLMPSATSTKSCLKKKSMSEILRPSVRYGPLVSSNSDTQLYKIESDRESIESDSSDCETSSTCSSISAPTTPIITTTPIKSNFSPVEKRLSQSKKIQFNDRVEQCIAVESDADVDDLHDSDTDSSSDDGIVITPKKKKRDSLISKLAPTKLKEDHIIYNSNSTPNIPSPSTTTTTNTTSPYEWMNDEDDFDYLDLDAIDFDQAISPSPSYHQAEAIIPPPDSLNENNDEDDDDDDGVTEIANGVKDLVHWCSGVVYNMAFRGRIF